MDKAIRLMEAGLIPESLIRMGIRRVVKERYAEIHGYDFEEKAKVIEDFIELQKNSEIAPLVEKANEQHYEVPAEFYSLVLGDYYKYSSCFWYQHTETLTMAEKNMLDIYLQRADIQDGQNVLELGCGWGSFSLYAAEKFPGAEFTALSNSSSQREFIEEQAEKRQINNLKIVTCDINHFTEQEEFQGKKYDRVVSIEMFEHLRNYQLIFKQLAEHLSSQAKVFIHIFCHCEVPYTYEIKETSDWMAKYFFTGGIMPAEHLLNRFQEDLILLKQWRVNGQHYEKTANAWAKNMDLNKAKVMPVLRDIYGNNEAGKWFMRWKVFFLACAELFGYRNGEEWLVAHYLFEKR